jgi:MarR family 2-MHQ and catechol resistance regulon transcriptional repressor
VDQHTASEFLVLENGMLVDKHARELSSWFSTEGHVRDQLAVEANYMAIRVGREVLEAGRPSNPMVSFARFNILRFLYLADGNRLSMSQLSQLLQVALANITKLVDGLVASGFVERIEDAADKRKTWAQLTAKGRAYAGELLPKGAMRVERNWSALTIGEKRTLVHLLTKVRLHLQIQDACERVLSQDEYF